MGFDARSAKAVIAWQGDRICRSFLTNRAGHRVGGRGGSTGGGSVGGGSVSDGSLHGDQLLAVLAIAALVQTTPTPMDHESIAFGIWFAGVVLETQQAVAALPHLNIRSSSALR